MEEYFRVLSVYNNLLMSDPPKKQQTRAWEAYEYLRIASVSNTRA